MKVYALITKKDDIEYVNIKGIYRKKRKLHTIYLKSLGALYKLTPKIINDELERYRGAKMLIKKILYECKNKDLRSIHNIELIAEILDIQPVREHNGQKVTSARIRDQNGDEANLDLWKEDTIKFKIGDKIHLKKGYGKLRVFEQDGIKKQIFDFTKGNYGYLEKYEENKPK